MRKKLFLSFVILSCALACALTLSGCSDGNISVDAFGVYKYDDSGSYLKADTVANETSVYGATISEIVTEIDVGWVRGKVVLSSSEEADSIVFSETPDFEGEVPDEFVMRYRLDGTVLKIRFAQNGVDLSSAAYEENPDNHRSRKRLFCGDRHRHRFRRSRSIRYTRFGIILRNGQRTRDRNPLLRRGNRF